MPRHHFGRLGWQASARAPARSLPLPPSPALHARAPPLPRAPAAHAAAPPPPPLVPPLPTHTPLHPHPPPPTRALPCRLYDCDFNQQLELGLTNPSHRTVWDVDSLDELTGESERMGWRW